MQLLPGYDTKDNSAGNLSEIWLSVFPDHRATMPAECRKLLLFRSFKPSNTLRDYEFHTEHRGVNQYNGH